MGWIQYFSDKETVYLNYVLAWKRAEFRGCGSSRPTNLGSRGVYPLARFSSLHLVKEELSIWLWREFGVYSGNLGRCGPGVLILSIRIPPDKRVIHFVRFFGRASRLARAGL